MGIKKARDFAEEYKANPTDKTLAGIAQEFGREIKELAVARRVNSIPALCAILKEQDRKWRAFVRRAGDDNIRPDGFKRTLQKRAPSLYYSCWPPGQS